MQFQVPSQHLTDNVPPLRVASFSVIVNHQTKPIFQCSKCSFKRGHVVSLLFFCQFLPSMIAFCSKTTLNAIEVKTFQELIFFLTISVMVCKYREELIKDCCTLEDVGGTVNLLMCYILAVLDLIVYQDPLLKILNMR